jgi:hypothetical protein
MRKEEIDKLIQNVCFDNYQQTVEACMEQWGIDLKGKDKHLMYPPMPPLPDTQDEVIKVINLKN